MSAAYNNNILPHEYRCNHTIAELRPLWCEVCGTLEECTDLYLKFKHAYYSGSPLITDSQFDNYEINCRRRFPNEQVFHTVGYKATEEEV